jgi:transcription elongation factor GreA
MPLDKGVTGYIENSAIDWSGLTNGLSKTVYDIGEKREIRKQELDDQWTDMNTQLESAEIPENQTLGDIFLNTTNAGTSKALEWNKQLKAGKISIDSPIGKGLVGKSVGEKVDVTVPAGVIPFEIIEISI